MWNLHFLILHLKMVCYHEQKRILYIHIPKTGGMTIENILIRMYGFSNFTFESGPHEFINNKEGRLGFYRYILKYSLESKRFDLESFFKFTFVRHPHTRSFSGIRYLHEKCIKRFLNFPENLLDFYFACHENDFYYTHFIMTQSDCIRNLHGNITMDYIGKFENLSDDLQYILIKLGFEIKDFSNVHLHKSTPKLLKFDENIVCRISDLIHCEDFKFYEKED